MKDSCVCVCVCSRLCVLWSARVGFQAFLEAVFEQFVMRPFLHEELTHTDPLCVTSFGKVLCVVQARVFVLCMLKV